MSIRRSCRQTLPLPLARWPLLVTARAKQPPLTLPRRSIRRRQQAEGAWPPPALLAIAAEPGPNGCCSAGPDRGRAQLCALLAAWRKLTPPAGKVAVDLNSHHVTSLLRQVCILHRQNSNPVRAGVCLAAARQSGARHNGSHVAGAPRGCRAATNQERRACRHLTRQRGERMDIITEPPTTSAEALWRHLG